MLHLAGDASCDVNLGAEHEAGNANVDLGGKPVDTLGERTGAAEAAANLVAEVASHLEVFFSAEATTSGNDNVGLVQINARLLDGHRRDELDGLGRSNPSEFLGRIGARSGSLSENASANAIEGNAGGLLLLHAHAAEVHVGSNVAIELDDVGDDAGASMSGNLASNDLHVAGRLNEHNAGLLSVKRSNHGVGSVVNDSAGVIISDTSIDIATVITDIEAKLDAMSVGGLLGLWFQSLFVGLTMKALSICIMLVVYGRMIEIYLVTSIAPIPVATMVNREWGGMGQNYLKSLLALGFQAFLILVCVGIYAVLIQTIAATDDISGAIWSCMGYTVLLCFTLFKTGSLAKSVFSAH